MDEFVDTIHSLHVLQIIEIFQAYLLFSLNNKMQKQQQSEEEQLSDYFEAQNFENISNFIVSSFYSEKILAGMQILINLGAVQISPSKKTVDQLLDHKEQGEQQRLVRQQQERKQFLKEQLKLLNAQSNNQMDPQESKALQLKSNRLILTKQEHEQNVRKFTKDQHSREERMNLRVIMMDQQLVKEQQERKRFEEEKKNIQLQLRRQRIEAKLEENKKKRQQLIRQNEESNRKIKQIQSSNNIYNKIEQKYEKQVLFPLLQQKKKKLRQIRQFKSFNIQQLKAHEKVYLQSKYLHESRRKQIKQDWVYQPPPKSQRLSVILEEQQLTRLKKIEDKLTQKQQRRNRYSEYVSYLKRHFVPKIDPVKKEEIQLRTQKQSRINNQADCRTIGLSYLQEAKRKRKIIATSLQQRSDTQPKLSEDLQGDSNLKKSIQSERTTKKIPRKAISIHKPRGLYTIFKDRTIQDSDKLKSFTIQADKIDEQIRRKYQYLKYNNNRQMKQQAQKLLLSSIQAKIGIFQMYDDDKNPQVEG